MEPDLKLRYGTLQGPCYIQLTHAGYGTYVGIKGRWNLVHREGYFGWERIYYITWLGIESTIEYLTVIERPL